jgi:hypothetical protein
LNRAELSGSGRLEAALTQELCCRWSATPGDPIAAPVPQRLRQSAPEKPNALRNAVANSGLGEDHNRIVRILFHLLTQLTDIAAQILRVFGVRRTPDRGQDLKRCELRQRRIKTK